jgi:methyl-accepting chemotaxis protein
LLNKIRGEGNSARIAIFKAQALREKKIIEDGLKVFETMDADFARIVALLKVQTDIEELGQTQKSAHEYRDTMKLILADESAMETIAIYRHDAAAKLNELVGETASTGIKRTVQAADEASSALAGSSLVVVVGLALTLLVGMGVAYFIVRNTSGVLTHVAGALREAAGQVASASAQVAGSSQTLAEGASEQASSLEETSASLEEINGMAKRSAENAQNAKSIAENTRVAADHGTQQMTEMLAAMTAIKASSDNISKVIKTIDEIAFQTNILALNAAVEAARAGEAGMGFAVVAEEVRGLAQRAAQAAKETATMIDESINRSGAGVGISERVAATLKDIAVKARDMNALVAEIATASVEQSGGVEQVNSAVAQMDQVTQGNAANAEESAAASEELNVQAKALTASVDDLMALVGHTQGYASVNAATDFPVERTSTPSRGNRLGQGKSVLIRPTVTKSRASQGPVEVN